MLHNTLVSATLLSSFSLLLTNPTPVSAHAHTPNSHLHIKAARSVCSTRSSNSSLHCILAQEATEGPYYVPHPLVRSNITEDRTGVPFTLHISVVDVATCEPVEGVYVDIWHADAWGKYSGWAENADLGASSSALSHHDHAEHHHAGPLQRRGWFSSQPEDSDGSDDSDDEDGPDSHGPPDDHQNPPGDHKGPPGDHKGPPGDHKGPPGDHKGAPGDHRGPPGDHKGPGRHGPPAHHAPTDSSRWLRGVQLTSSSGIATFRTVFPGWYSPRTTHVHVRIHAGNASVSEGEDGSDGEKHLMLDEAGRTAHTGQFFFSDELVKRVAESELPYSEHLKTEKPMYNNDDGIYLRSGGGEQLVVVKGAEDGEGLTGWITVGIDPSASNEGDEHGPGGPHGPHGGHFGKYFVAKMVGVFAVAAIGTWGLMRGIRWWKHKRETKGYIVLE